MRITNIRPYGDRPDACNIYSLHMDRAVSPRMKAAALTPEFVRVAQLAKEATGLTPAPETSTPDTTGLWHLRDAHNESICEVAPDGTVVELCVEAPPLGLLDRIRDLRACGYSTRAIHAWFGMPKTVDQLAEARRVFSIAVDHMADLAGSWGPSNSQSC